MLPARSAAQERDTAVLDPVVISATQTPVQKSSLTQQVTVITGKELRDRGIARLSDALRVVPGAAVTSNGSFGSVTTLFLRGGESRYTRVLIDGVAVNSSGGFFDFSHLTTDNIDRIEIVRGPGSVVHGADAMTGTIQIFTRRGSGPSRVTADARAGTYGTREASLSLAGRKDATSYSISGAHHFTDGILPFNNQYLNGTLSSSVGYSGRAGENVSATARYTTAEFHYPTDYTGAPVDSNSYRVQHRLTVGTDAVVPVSRVVETRINVGSNEVWDLTEDINVPFGAQTQQHLAQSSYSRRRNAGARAQLTLPSIRLTAGAEIERESERSIDRRGPVGGPQAVVSRFSASRDVRAGFVELLGSAAHAMSYTLAARVDDNSDFDTHTTYRVGAKGEVVTGLSVRASISTAFNAPAFNQLRPTLFTVGSPNLRPETARTWEAGVEEELANGAIRLSAGYFNQRFNDLIQFVSGGPPDFRGSFANLARAQSNGYELGLDARGPAGLILNASYTQATPHVTKLSTDYSGSLHVGDALIRRPSHSATATVTQSPIPRLTVSLSANYVGKRPDLDFNLFPATTLTLPSYTRVDGAASFAAYRSSRNELSLTFRAENALNRKYEDVLHFQSPGRVILVGARFDGGL
ncbi:MAG TPA: TonB-dependent receptor [Gemmatimonadaceae bacterium]